jgi:uncharacterized protein with GYD domain
MATYICLLRWTGKGIEHVNDSPSRLDAARKMFEAAGATLKDFYMVMGQYDMVITAEAPNDGAMAKAILSLTKKGAVKGETMRAFTETEYRSIMSGLLS